MSAVSCVHTVSDLVHALRALKQQQVACESAVNPDLVFKSITTHHGQGSFPGLFVPLKGEKADGHIYLHEYLQAHPQNVALCGLSFKTQVPDWYRSRVVFVPDPLMALQQWAVFYRKQLVIDLIAITGSSGKTTFKDLLVSILGQQRRVVGTVGNLNNHIGVPLTVLSLTRDTPGAVFELGMNHPGEIAALAAMAQPTCGAILNVGRAHVGLLGSVENVAKAKGELVPSVASRGGKTYGLEPYRRWFDPALAQYVTWVKPQALPSGWTRVSAWKLQFNHDTVGLEAVDLASVGVGQETLALALRMASDFQVTPEQMWQGIKIFSRQQRGLRGSLQTVGRHWIFLDCYNANPDSFQFSLERACYLAREVPAVGFVGWYGDMGELGDHALALHRSTLELLRSTPYPQSEVRQYFLGPWFKKSFESMTARQGHSSFYFLNNVSEAEQILQQLLALQVPQFFHVKASRASQLEKLFEPYLSTETASPVVK